MRNLKRVLALSMVAMLTLTSCGSSSGSETTAAAASAAATEAVSEAASTAAETIAETSAPADVEAASESAADSGKKAVEVDKKLLTVDITISPSMAEAFDLDDSDLRDEGYFDKIVKNDDGSYTITTTKAKHQELMKEIETQMDESFQQIIDDESCTFTEIKPNKDYTSFTVKMTGEELNLTEMFSVIVFYTYGGMYNVFNGGRTDNVHVDFVSDSTGDVIESVDSGDLEEYFSGLADWANSEGTGNTEENTEDDASDSKAVELSIGEPWIVDGQWELMITGVTETEDRNEYSDKDPGAVYIVDYCYTNLGYEADYWDGLFLSLDDTIVDASGKMGYSYPGSTVYSPQETPVGATCKAQACIGVDNPGPFKITKSTYDGSGKKQKATFSLDVDADAVEYTPPKAEANADSLKIGETWTVDGQWELTITGVAETEDRNEYSEKKPEAAYIVDYTYTNIGYESDTMDGLFMSIDDTIVDAAGWMGYSYPVSVSKNPQETPVGATCEAQVCIGVDHAGSFRITKSAYDGNGERQGQTFTVDVE